MQQLDLARNENILFQDIPSDFTENMSLRFAVDKNSQAATYDPDREHELYAMDIYFQKLMKMIPNTEFGKEDCAGELEIRDRLDSPNENSKGPGKILNNTINSSADEVIRIPNISNIEPESIPIHLNNSEAINEADTQHLKLLNDAIDYIAKLRDILNISPSDENDEGENYSTTSERDSQSPFDDFINPEDPTQAPTHTYNFAESSKYERNEPPYDNRETFDIEYHDTDASPACSPPKKSKFQQ